MNVEGQEPKGLPAPPGVVYSTTMTRPDAALALAALYVSASRRQARVAGICVSHAGFDAAIFCDIVGRFYNNQARTPSSNSVLPIGFAAATPIPPDPPMVEAAVKRVKAEGQPQYARSIQRVSDTSLPEALLRNAITFTVETVVVLSAPATSLARSLELAGTVAQYKQRVKRVVLVEAGGIDEDAAALKALVAALPVPVVYCGREIGSALAVPRSRLDSAFTWAPANPVADAVTASEGASVALHDVAAIHYALHPDSGFFSVGSPGPHGVPRLEAIPEQAERCLADLLALATSKPATPPAREGRG